MLSITFVTWSWFLYLSTINRMAALHFDSPTNQSNHYNADAFASFDPTNVGLIPAAKLPSALKLAGRDPLLASSLLGADPDPTMTIDFETFLRVGATSFGVLRA
jgi:Ca2+-binding EF-hand superfamily protein